MNATDILSSYGLTGLVIAVLAGVIVWQQKRIDTLYKDKDALQQSRLTDAISARDKYAEVMDGFSTTTELLYNKLTKTGQ